MTLTLPLPPAVERAASRSGPARAAACDAGVRALRGSASRWRVDTGRSKRAWRRIGTGPTSRVFNPLHYARYLEDGIPDPSSAGLGAATLHDAAPQMTSAARSALATETSRSARSAESRAGIRRARTERARIEIDEELYERYLANFEARGRLRAPNIPAAIREQDRLIRIRASVGMPT